MPLPAVNPIDSGWLSRGTPIDHLGTVTIRCRACGSDRRAERFKVILGSSGGVGAPFFVAPFLKRRSTAGKIGGNRGQFSQCMTCKSLWPDDDEARQTLARSGLDPSGLVSDAVAYEMLNREAAAQEQAERGGLPGGSKIRKLPAD